MSEARMRKSQQFHSAIFDSPGPSGSSAPSNPGFAYQKYNEKSNVFTSPVIHQETPDKRRTHESNPEPSSIKRAQSTKNPSNRKSASSKSSIFDPIDPIPYKENPFKPKDTLVFGTDKTVYKHKTETKTFEPNYAFSSPYERKSLNLYGVIVNKPETPEKCVLSPEPKQRRTREMKSNIFYEQQEYENDYSNNAKQKPRAFTPEVRKAEIYSSSIFGDKPLVMHDNESKEKKSNNNQRKKHHMNSEVFGSSIDYKPVIKQKEEQPQEDFDPSTQKQRHLMSAIINGNRNLVNLEKKAKEPEEKKPSFDPALNKQRDLATRDKEYQTLDYTPTVVTYDLKGSPEKCSENLIKKLSEGLHVIDIHTETNPLSGIETGKATITIRGKGPEDTNVKEMCMDLISHGISVSEHNSDHGYNVKYESIAGVKWDDVKTCQKYTQNNNARELKIKNLESSTGIVGNASRWSDDWKQKSIKQGIDKQLIEQFKWKQTRSPKKKII
ncbi:hypothetical protein SteCoe_6694 [Stentor coeruleus]|uniref:Uncharacterized protein n=1 Tax=Stentor coeruleus TaxID=5963 RepID=A0A1R2CP93_9CILI|nr:hypothetical protein SteCoe_6694 [Stentor coeruleus]